MLTVLPMKHIALVKKVVDLSPLYAASEENFTSDQLKSTGCISNILLNDILN